MPTPLLGSDARCAARSAATRTVSDRYAPFVASARGDQRQAAQPPPRTLRDHGVTSIVHHFASMEDVRAREKFRKAEWLPPTHAPNGWQRQKAGRRDRPAR